MTPSPRPSSSAGFSTTTPRARVGIELSLNGVTVPAEVDLAVIAEAVAGMMRTEPEWPPWMSTTTAAAYLDMTVEALAKLRARGRIPSHSEGPGCRVWYSRDELDTAMREMGS